MRGTRIPFRGFTKCWHINAHISRLSATDACNIKTFDQVAGVIANCTNIAITDLSVPGNTTLDLTKLKPNSTVTFYGRTVWEYIYGANSDLMKIKGSNITLQGAPCSVLDGQGQFFWDGIGTNGGVPKSVILFNGSHPY